MSGQRHLAAIIAAALAVAGETVFRLRITASPHASRANPAGNTNFKSKEKPLGRITFQKRQKEMKRQEKQKMKAERRAQRKLEKSAGTEASNQQSAEAIDQQPDIPAETDPQQQN